MLNWEFILYGNIVRIEFILSCLGVLQEIIIIKKVVRKSLYLGVIRMFNE